jgi:hypothetical protein
VPDLSAPPHRLADRLRALPPAMVDAAIAVVCYLATVGLPVKAATAQWWLLALSALASLPLVWRRRYPIVVTALVGAGMIGLALAGGLNDVPLPYGQLVATYTFASLSPPLWRLLGVVGTVAGVIVLVLVLVLALAAYRVVQESLTNTVRHAGARRVRVRLDWRQAALHVEVSDDGHGPAPDGHPGHGLVGMRERVTACGGDLRTGVGDGGVGFRVAAALPFPAGGLPVEAADG